MADSTVNGIMESLMEGMNSLLSAKTVVGEATSFGDTIILPLVDVSFAVGVGASNNASKNGGGGGMGGKMTPSAVLVIKGGQTKLVNIKNQDTLTKLLDLIPDILEKFTPKKNDMPADEEAVKMAFPGEKER